MIVRCNNCVSAFAVDDEKIANKKFAFKCPKCSSENIIDNRIAESNDEKIKPQPDDSFFNDDFSVDNESFEKDMETAKSADSHDDDLFFNDSDKSKKGKDEDEFSSLEDELASEFPAEDISAEPVKKDRNINLEIEESADFPELDDDIFSEKPSPSKKDAAGDLSAEVPAFDSDDDFISFDDESVKTPSDDFEIDLKDDSAKTEDDDILFDDFEESSAKPAKKDSSDSIEDDTVFEFEDIETETLTEETKNERDKKLSSQDDIDALFAEEGVVFDEQPISKQSELELEDEITVDLDMLDIELDEPGDENLKEEKPPALKSVNAVSSDIDDITLDIDHLDIDLDESSLDTDIFSEPVKAGKQKEQQNISDDDITLDIDNLDIDLDESSLDTDIFSEPVKAGKQKEQQNISDDDITLDIDNLDIDLDESSLDTDIFSEPVKAGKQKEQQIVSDDDITLDIDNLDIDLDESSLDTDIFSEPSPVKSSKTASKADIQFDDEFNEEDIKLNLDDLDIDLDEIEERELIFEDDIIDTPPPVSRQKSKPIPEEDDEDESITIDLDTLEIEIAEGNSGIRDELSEEDEKLTLDDAGLTFDELTSEMKKSDFEEPADEELKLTLNDIDPELTLDEIVRTAKSDNSRLSDSIDELPEIDFDEYDATVRQEENRVTKKSGNKSDDEFVLFPDLEVEKTVSHRYDYDDTDDYEEPDQVKSAPERGNTFFSIDLSLKYSRLGALLRLLLLYNLSMIPHFVVMLVYTLLSSIVGFINQIVVLSTGRCVEDFALVIENTMRYFFYIKTNIIGIVEDRPVYAGRESIDHPLQLNITYPVKYSKNLAILRLSIIGILLITLPHLIIMTLITLTVPLVYLIGIIIVLITRRWPSALFVYLTKYFRYTAKISSFMIGLTDEYPPFNFD